MMPVGSEGCGNEEGDMLQHVAHNYVTWRNVVASWRRGMHKSLKIQRQWHKKITSEIPQLCRSIPCKVRLGGARCGRIIV